MGMALNSGIGSQIGQAGLGQSPIGAQAQSNPGLPGDPQQGFGMPAQGYDPTIDPATGLPMQQNPQQGFGMPGGVLNQNPGAQGFQNPGAQPMPTVGQGGGKAGGMDLSQIGQLINQTGPDQMQQPQPMQQMPVNTQPPMQQLPPGMQQGFGMPAQGYGAAPQMQQPMSAAPVNRFAPPNAPGVRTAQPLRSPIINKPIINKPVVSNARPVIAKPVVANPAGRSYTTGLTARR